MTHTDDPKSNVIRLGDAMRQPPTGYRATQLNDRDDSWAVVEHPSGAIVEDAFDEMLIRLTQNEAFRIADQMTKDLDANPPTD